MLAGRADLDLLAETGGKNATIVSSLSDRELAIKNLEYAIAQAGFDVEDTPGNATKKAGLPEACR